MKYTLAGKNQFIMLTPKQKVDIMMFGTVYPIIVATAALLAVFTWVPILGKWQFSVTAGIVLITAWLFILFRRRARLTLETANSAKLPPLKPGKVWLDHETTFSMFLALSFSTLSAMHHFIAAAKSSKLFSYVEEHPENEQDDDFIVEIKAEFDGSDELQRVDKVLKFLGKFADLSVLLLIFMH